MAKKRKPGALYFNAIARVSKDFVVLTGSYYALEESTKPRIALLSLNQGVWGSIDLAGVAHSLRYMGGAKKKKTFLILDRRGILYRISPPEDVQSEQIGEGREGFLMDLRRIGSSWYSVGGHHRIHREIGGVWNAFDDGIYVAGEDGDTSILLSIDGLSESDIYSVGTDGFICHYNGKAWKTLDSPTNAGLQKVLCVTKDEIYACGDANGVFVGNGQHWRALTDRKEGVTFWDMVTFHDKVYVCTDKKLFVVKDEGLEPVEIPIKGALAFYRMDADQDEMWTCGDECLLKFDGNDWQRYDFPDNT